MSYRSNKLRIVSNSGKVASSVSKHIGEAVSRWKHLEDRLATLIERQDAALSDTPIDTPKVESLQAMITKIEQDQGAILYEIADRPGQNLYDVAAKLEIWNMINSPSENEWGQSSNHLVASALSDLQQKIDGSS